MVAPALFLGSHPPIDRAGEGTFAHLFEESLSTDGDRVLVPGADASSATPRATLARRA